MVADLWDRGIDLGDRELRRTRSWHWLQLQIEGLLAVPPQLIVDRWQDGRGSRVRVLTMPQTRLALSLDPPDLDQPTASPQED